MLLQLVPFVETCQLQIVPEYPVRVSSVLLPIPKHTPCPPVAVPGITTGSTVHETVLVLETGQKDAERYVFISTLVFPVVEMALPRV
jgi:hypothetical protein